MLHVSTVPASPCAGTDGWAILAEPPGVRDLEDMRYWETSLERSRRRRGAGRARTRLPRELRVAAALAAVAAVSPAAATASSGDLSLGASGAAVRQLQAKLGVAVDGQFGPQTEAAVRAFQRAHGIPSTGLVGPLTRAALGQAGSSPVRSAPVSASAAQVRALQSRLGVTADGVVGPATRAAVRAFKASHGLPATGQIDAQTLAALGVGRSAPSSTQAPPPTTSKAATAVHAAMSKIGSPYSYGATGPASFDCSGLVMYALRQAGVSVPHSSFAQYGLGRAVSSDQIQAGDLVFFNTAGAGASDVGLATSPTTAVSATTHGVMTHPIRSGYWGSHYVGARRLL